MTPERLSEIESRAAAATPGPWHLGGEAQVWNLPCERKNRDRLICVASYDSWPSHRELKIEEEDANGAFIAHARIDIPDLCAALRNAWHQMDAYREMLALIKERAEMVRQIVPRRLVGATSGWYASPDDQQFRLDEAVEAIAAMAWQALGADTAGGESEG